MSAEFGSRQITFYQQRKLKLLFLQFADKIDFTGQQTHKDPIDFTLTTRIGVVHLSELLSHLGPYISTEQAKQFIYEYDSSLTGSFGLDDFLEFMNDYILILRKARKDAIRVWYQYKSDETDDSIEFLEEYPTYEKYLEYQGLEDPSNILDTTEEISEQIQNSFKISDQNLLTRHLSIRIFAAHRLASCLRIKKRSSREIQYFTLDPFISVKCAGIVKNTTIIYDGAWISLT
jgi:hypothetical protein